MHPTPHLAEALFEVFGLASREGSSAMQGFS